MIEMKVAGIAIDAKRKPQPDRAFERQYRSCVLLIYIILTRSNKAIITLETRNLPTLTHDLLVNILEVWDWLSRCHSSDPGGTFYAILTVRQGEVKKRD